MRSFVLFACMFLNFIWVHAGVYWTDRGNYSISWFNSTKQVFEISTAEEFAGIAYLQNQGYTNFKGKTIILKNDINLGGGIWVPIGDKANPFRGSIQGNNHTIKGIDVRFNSNYHYFGLFGALKDASLSDIILQGIIKIEIENYYTTQYIGSCCGYAADTDFNNIISKVNIKYNREKSSSDKYEICIGGFAGYLDDCNLEDVHFQNDYYVYFGGGGLYGGYLKNSSFNFAGLIGDGFGDKISYCSVRSNVYLYLGASHNLDTSNSVSFAGITRASGYTIQGCRVIIESIEIQHSWKAGLDGNIYLGGIAYWPDGGTPAVKRGAQNNYAVILNAKTTLPYGEFHYGGIFSYERFDLQYYPERFVANYSNKDFKINNTVSPSISTASFIKGYNGVSDFTAEEMKTQAFVDELNLYYTLNGKDPHWYYVEGDYPHISIDPIIPGEEPDGIDTVGIDPDEKISIYSIDGVLIKMDSNIQDLKTLRKGIYIIISEKRRYKIAV